MIILCHSRFTCCNKYTSLVGVLIMRKAVHVEEYIEPDSQFSCEFKIALKNGAQVLSLDTGVFRAATH